MSLPNAAVSSHRRALDGLRGIAILLVMAFHYKVPGFRRGALGVDIFFVLSGFLITSLLLDEHQRNGRIDIKKFLIRRALRLAPLHCLFALVCTLGFVFGALEIRSLSPGVSAWLLFLSIWFYFRNYTGAAELHIIGNDVGVCRHLWSLALEEQFYFLWPWCFRVLKRFQGLAWLLLLVFVAQVLKLLMSQSGLNMFYLSVRGVGLVAGAIGAFCMQYAEVRRSLQSPIVSTLLAITLGALFVAISLGPGAGVTSLVAAKLILSPFVVITAALCGSIWVGGKGIVIRVLGVAPLTYLGKISYGLYLWHPLVQAGVGWLFPHAPVPLAICLAALGTLTLSALTFRYYEEPFLNLKARWR